ncbi:hypothetical protein ACHAWO_011208 [Cyclotella atomus]|uniref:Uncharacterized protein n=1 Tax=Cyclotella atomus TaxID=382360 RepID=A0ABD3PC15_9STRA
MPAAQRRKIFPHLDKEKPPTAAANSTKPDEEENYDNAKTSKKHPSATRNASKANGKKDSNTATTSNTIKKEAPTHHLLPLPLVLLVILCSGFHWISSFRDMMATGKPILDNLGIVLWEQSDADINLLQYTKSTAWYDDSRGWKSKQGGLSTILPVTTDANNMGGLFVRKLSGAAGMAFHTSKLWPVVFQSFPYYQAGKDGMIGPSWSGGHYDPLILLGMGGDLALGTFYLVKLEEIKSAGADRLGMVYVLTAVVEAIVFGLYVFGRRMSSGGRMVQSTSDAEAKTDDPLDDPKALPSRIVARTVLIVSSLMSIISIRDLMFPGTILSFIPRDDIYLEWTGAFLHSPPPDTVESDEHGLEAPLYAGDKFVSQLMGLYVFLCCIMKFASVIGWTKGSRSMGKGVQNVDRWGVVASRLIWKTMAMGDLSILMLLRMFTPAAQTASLDLRWHLMMVAYEMFILFLYAFW